MAPEAERITPECFASLRGSKTTFLPGMGRRGGELRDAGWAESLGVDNLILIT